LDRSGLALPVRVDRTASPGVGELSGSSAPSGQRLMDGIDDCTNRAASPAVRTVAARRDRSVHLTEYDLVL